MSESPTPESARDEETAPFRITPSYIFIEGTTVFSHQYLPDAVFNERTLTIEQVADSGEISVSISGRSTTGDGESGHRGADGLASTVLTSDQAYQLADALIQFAEASADGE